MANVQIAPFGSWKSPITSALIVAETIRLGGVAFDGEDIYWVEEDQQKGAKCTGAANTGWASH